MVFQRLFTLFQGFSRHESAFETALATRRGRLELANSGKEVDVLLFDAS